MSFRKPTNLVVIALCCTVILFSLFFFRNGHLSATSYNYLGLKGTADSNEITGHVYNSTLGFEKIFVVGLPSRTDRRDSMVLAAALSNIEIEFIDGVLGPTVPDKAIPSGPEQGRLPEPAIGSWRGHMNAIQEVVRRNLTSVLILEDDADWDIRIRDQLYAFALSSQALTQPLRGTKGAYIDSTYPKLRDGSPSAVSEVSLEHLPATEAPKVSPYGDHWDAFWIGHCGMHFPFEDNTVIPKGRVVHTDPTVPQQQYLWTIANPDDVKEQYPNHTRVAHHVQDGVCSLGYAVSQNGARQLLYELGLKNFNAAFDILLRWYCEGVESRRYHNCLTLQPSLFQHHRPAGPKKYASDISDHGDGFQEKPYTDVIRWSVRMNAEGLLAGEPPVDQWPDT